MKIKTAVLDLDGTLLSSQDSISQRNTDTVNLAHKKGIKIIIASGRRYSSITPYLDSFDFTCPIIAYSGSWIVEEPGSKPLIEHKVSWEPAADLARRVKGKVEMVGVYINDLLYLDNRNIYSQKYENRIHHRAKLVPDLAFFLESERIDPTRLLIISDRTESLDKLYKEVKEIYRGKLDFVKSGPTFLEAGKIGVTKGSSLTLYAKLRGLNLKEAVAFGDQENDIPSFRACGMSVAMDNAPAEVKREAKMLAPSNDEDGVARVLERLMECA